MRNADEALKKSVEVRKSLTPRNERDSPSNYASSQYNTNPSDKYYSPKNFTDKLDKYNNPFSHSKGTKPPQVGFESNYSSKYSDNLDYLSEIQKNYNDYASPQDVGSSSYNHYIPNYNSEDYSKIPSMIYTKGIPNETPENLEKIAVGTQKVYTSPRNYANDDDKNSLNPIKEESHSHTNIEITPRERSPMLSPSGSQAFLTNSTNKPPIPISSGERNINASEFDPSAYRKTGEVSKSSVVTPQNHLNYQYNGSQTVKADTDRP